MSGHPIEQLGDEPQTTSDDVPIILRVGFLAAAGTLAALASALTAAIRTGDEPFSVGRVLEQWLVLSAIATPLGIAGVALLRRARIGLQIVVGDRVNLPAMAFLWWCVVELALLSVFAAVLRKTTHHHALAGVTFAMFAVVTGIVAALFAVRVTGVIARVASPTQRHALMIAGACLVVGVLLALLRTSRAEGMHASSGIIDAIAFFAMTAFASSRVLRRTRLMAVAGLPAALLLVMIGLTTLRFDPKLAGALPATAPLHAFVVELFGP